MAFAPRSSEGTRCVVGFGSTAPPSVSAASPAVLTSALTLGDLRGDGARGCGLTNCVRVLSSEGGGGVSGREVVGSACPRP